MGTFLPGDQVFVTNEGDHPVELGWANRRYIIEPGKERIVPVEAAIMAVGDPRSGEKTRTAKINEETIFIPSRRDEVTRLRARYGILIGREDMIPLEPQEAPKVEGGTPPLPVPRLKVRYEDGSEMVTVIDDPTGTVASGPITVDPSTSDLVKLLERQQRQLNMQAEALRQSGITVNMADPISPVAGESELPTDDPVSAQEPRKSPPPKKRSPNPDLSTLKPADAG